MKAKYFISYRRVTDGPTATSLAAALNTLIGEAVIFFDRDERALPPGTVWDVDLVSNVARCQVEIVVIGPGWQAEMAKRNQSATGEWLDRQKSPDWVRREIALGLQLGKLVVPFLVGGARMPKVEDMPPEFAELRKRQVFTVDANLPMAAEAERLLQWLEHTTNEHGPVDLPPMTRPPTTPPDLPDDVNAFSGKRWNPLTEKDSPHVYDYKFCILDPDVRERIRIALLAANHTGILRQHFSLAELQKYGEPRKYFDSPAKLGMFIQASCIVTDGLADDVVRQVLFCIRSESQFHDPEKVIPRNVTGESCLFASCLTSFGMHERTGHLAKAILNDLDEPNPWAVFSRKLLLPDSLIDGKFLGIGFNLSDPTKEYVHLIWHIRTRICPEAMIVPSRADTKNRFDVPVWQSMDQLRQYDFDSAPIDRLVIEKCLNIELPPVPNPESSKFYKAPWLTGFVPYPGFDNTQANGQRPMRWNRDTVVLDYLRMYQQTVHRSKVEDRPHNPRDVLQGFQTYLETILTRYAIPTTVQQAKIPHAAAPFDQALDMTLSDEVGNPITNYRVFAIETLEPEPTQKLTQVVRELSFSSLPEDRPLHAIAILQAVHTPSTYDVQGSLSLHDAGQLPIHVIRLAVDDRGRPVKRVVHAIMPVRKKPGQTADSLLVTQCKANERWRLPGGKIEGAETPPQAILRELQEELGVPEESIEIFSLGLEGGINFVEMSPKDGRLTEYRIYPVMARIRPEWASFLKARIEQPVPDGECKIWPETFEHWRATGFGFDVAYPEAVLAKLTGELRDVATTDLGG